MRIVMFMLSFMASLCVYFGWFDHDKKNLRFCKFFGTVFGAIVIVLSILGYWR